MRKTPLKYGIIDLISPKQGARKVAGMFTYDDILRPLALAVIIDNKIRDPELATFCQRARDLMPLFNLPQPSRTQIRRWFGENEPEINRILRSRRRNTFVLKTLTRFKEDIHVENLYEAMLAISISDAEYVVEESDLVKSAATIWGYERPPFKIKDI